MDYSYLRRLMVETQLIPRGIKDRRVIDAMLKVPRHLFVEESIRHKSYDDMAISIGDGQTISQPYMVAKMTELLELSGVERVLEVGTGSGYQAAILAELALEVYSVERFESLARGAEERLRSLGYSNIHIIVGDGTEGLPGHAPFDRIIVTAGTPMMPEPLKEQLSGGGIIVAPVGSRYNQILVKLKREGERFAEESSTPCVFVPLIGRYGWSGQ